MTLDNYKSGDLVEVLVNNPERDNREEWRTAKVIGIQTVYPENGSRHKPYPMVVVKVNRTYCKAKPNYKYLDGSVKKVKVFVDNTLEFYTKESTEGFIYSDQVRLL